MKKLLTFILTLVLLCSLLAVPAQAAGSGSLSVGSVSGYRGDTVTVDVYMNSNPGLITMKFQVSYSANLTLVSVSNSGLLNGWTTPAPTISSPYTIRWADSLATTNNTSTGKLVTLTFKINDNAAIGTETVSIIFNESRDAEGSKNSFSGAAASITIKCNHSYGEWKDAGDGNHSQTCPTCQDTKTEAHKWDNGSETKKATCKEGGQIQYTCTVCKATKTEDTAKTDKHSFGNLVAVNDTQHKDVCSVCKQEITENHTWNSGAVTTQPTCTKEGEKTYTCTGCKETKTEPVPVNPHTYGAWEKVDANTHKRTCTVCKEETETGIHSYNTSWSKDKDQHWHECSVCKDKKDAEAHKPGEEATEEKAQTCTVCNYIIAPALGHKHDYSDKWTTDEKGHWYVCPGCEEKGSYADHDFENACDKDCSICGFTRETEHKFEDKWTTDAANHWHACTGCGLKQDEAAHEAGPEATETTAQTCTICGYEIAPALGGEEETQPVQTVIVEESQFPWWIVIVAAVVVIGGVVIVIIKKKKA